MLELVMGYVFGTTRSAADHTGAATQSSPAQSFQPSPHPHTHQSHQGYGVGITELFRKLAKVNTGLLKVECDRLEVAAQLLVGFGQGHLVFPG